jgi:aminodeoxychorismate synthase component I
MSDIAQAPAATFHLLEPLQLKLPFFTYQALFRGADFAFLLDSALESPQLGRFSFLGGEPFLVLRAKRCAGDVGDRTARIEADYRAEGASPAAWSSHVRETGDALEALRALLRTHAVDCDELDGGPVPFLSGAVGYFGYETGHLLEDLPDTGVDDLALPDVYFMFCDQVLSRCHRTGTTRLATVGRGDSRAAARRAAVRRRDEMLRRIAVLEADPPPAWTGPPSSDGATGGTIDVEGDFDEHSYCQAVEAIKQRILAGDIYQACMTHRLRSPLYGGNAWNLYEELRRINPAPFAAYLKFPEAQIVSASPERFLSVDTDGVAESRPIKGTRPRSPMPEADLALKDELANSIKDRAENIMIVDLVRNDFGRVCEFGSIDVPELMVIEPYATVFQMVSTVRGRLQNGADAVDLVRACFPGGSMTGAPKIEAMKVIDHLEPVCRSVYSGSIGYFDFAGPMDLSMVIRSFVVKDGWCYYNVGGGIVADSDPRAEYFETLTKARALKTALANLRAHAEAAR